MDIKETEGSLLCAMDPHMDTPKCIELESALKARLAQPVPVVFDMEGVNYVCSAFLRVCLFVVKAAGRGNLRMTHVAPPIKRVFLMAGLGEMVG